MVVDDGVLEKDDMFILDRMKEFLVTEEAVDFPAAKRLLTLIEVAVLISLSRTLPDSPTHSRKGAALELRWSHRRSCYNLARSSNPGTSILWN
jgi:hypothetical protein